MNTKNVLPLDYIALHFVDALRWEGWRYSPGFLDAARQQAREWGISQTVVDVAVAHGHVDAMVPS
jgi:hypothetical protein